MNLWIISESDYCDVNEEELTSGGGGDQLLYGQASSSSPKALVPLDSTNKMTWVYKSWIFLLDNSWYAKDSTGLQSH